MHKIAVDERPQKKCWQTFFASVRRVLSRRRRGGFLRDAVHVTLLSTLLFAVSGYSRGEEPDRAAAHVVRWLQDLIRNALASGWVHPFIADTMVLVLTFVIFSAGLILIAIAIRRVPAFVGFFILAELHRRQGHALSVLELLLAITLPIALVLALECTTVVSVYAWVHFVLGYAYIRLASDTSRIDSILNWFVRIRTAVAPDDLDDFDDDAVGEV